MKLCTNAHENEDTAWYCSLCGVRFPAETIVPIIPTASDLREEERLRTAALVGSENLDKVERKPVDGRSL